MDELTLEFEVMSRRGLLAALGAAAATGAAVALPSRPAHAASTRAGSEQGGPAVASLPVAAAAPRAGLAYVGLDALAFRTADQTNSAYINYTRAGGVAPSVPGAPMFAPLVLPAGSVVKQLNASYLLQPTITISRRAISSTTPVDIAGPFGLDPGGSQTVDLTSPFTIAADSTYFVTCICSRSSESLFGVTIGYLPAVQGFVPYAGSTPRVYDSRQAGGLLQPGEDRVVALGSAASRSAVFNLAVDATQPGTTGGGFVGAFSAAVAVWPQNASVNWGAKGTTASNTVICALDDQGRIKLHGGASAVHVIIDLIGFLT